jgi:hypothetical protein
MHRCRRFLQQGSGRLSLRVAAAAAQYGLVFLVSVLSTGCVYKGDVNAPDVFSHKPAALIFASVT